ncbi:branched-chain amino acid ABC transporter permease (plasmid) [Agrobacterium tumefaciens]|uniref:branched-chain amino acid ABC transporter permease n=1 Tax=Agrobacterium tumefaciens TaxID=358 RepID=UPI0015744C77|nr:branched-chain amino acid ABC transporter permease [Agrobacterium tumefaciens]NSZ66453.1 branched-chain amino acid ABC transporter permease [Agrobacterium tumefaciens]NTA72825.1 branched-chain amino acid ABC transporter permease [Agrobacterium tumefaciens]WIE41374.1 branched-chain amino acid ABC transporter permease [Agrobacterium tumefaciens]
MDLYLVLLLDVINGTASLFLLCLGLAIIFGMMKIINLAHGELVMLGAYATVISANAGINIWVAMLLIAPLFVGLVGLVIERCLIRFLYGRLVDSMLATWGLSLLIIGVVTTAFGDTIQGVATPLGGFSIGSYRSSYYTLFLLAVAVALMAMIYGVMRYTRLGLIARATMQNPAMADTLGVNPARVYMGTFATGAAMSGLAGGLLAPVSGVTPVMGGAYVAKAFITVVGGGAAILSGTLSASSLFGSITQIAAYFTTPVYGEVIVFIAAILLIRLLPQGISGRFFKGSI